MVSGCEPYALAWGMYSEFLTVNQFGTNLRLSWPVYPAGFEVVTAPSLNPPATWSANNVPMPVYGNNQNVIWLAATNGAQFFRLQTPDF